MGKKKKYVVRDEKGPPCFRCGKPTEVREHDEIRNKQLSQPYYYTRWYCCMNSDCRTTLIMPDAHRVFNEPQNKLEFIGEF